MHWQVSLKNTHTHTHTLTFNQFPIEAITSVKNDINLSKPLQPYQTTANVNLLFHTFAYQSELNADIPAYISAPKTMGVLFF